MNHRRCVEALLIAAWLTIGVSTHVSSHETSQSRAIVVSQADDISTRAKQDVELGRLKAVDKPMTKSPKQSDVVKTAVRTAQELMQGKRHSEALAMLAKLDTLAGKSAEETYLIERTRVAIASLANDDTLLIKSMEAALASGQSPAGERSEFLHLLARKYFNRMNYPQAIEWSSRYIDEGGKDAAIRRLQLLAWYLNNDFVRAQKEVAADVQAEESAGRKPSKEQMRLLVSSAQKLDDKVALASAMAKYAAYYPDKK